MSGPGPEVYLHPMVLRPTVDEVGKAGLVWTVPEDWLEIFGLGGDTLRRGGPDDGECDSGELWDLTKNAKTCTPIDMRVFIQRALDLHNTHNPNNQIQMADPMVFESWYIERYPDYIVPAGQDVYGVKGEGWDSSSYRITVPAQQNGNGLSLGVLVSREEMKQLLAQSAVGGTGASTVDNVVAESTPVVNAPTGLSEAEEFLGGLADEETGEGDVVAANVGEGGGDKVESAKASDVTPRDVEKSWRVGFMGIISAISIFGIIAAVRSIWKRSERDTTSYGDSSCDDSDRRQMVRSGDGKYRRQYKGDDCMNRGDWLKYYYGPAKVVAEAIRIAREAYRNEDHSDPFWFLDQKDVGSGSSAQEKLNAMLADAEIRAAILDFRHIVESGSEIAVKLGQKDIEALDFLHKVGRLEEDAKSVEILGHYMENPLNPNYEADALVRDGT